MTVIAQTKPKFGAWLAATILSPFIIMSFELWVTRKFGHYGTDWDYAGVALAIAVGLCCLWRLPVTIAARLWFTVAYVPVGAGLLLMYSLFFVCVVFGDCL
jgi:hypothetical protein